MSRPRILIVEDEGVINLDLRRRIENLGFSLSGSAQSGPEAIKLLEQGNTSLVLMDIQLGSTLDGIELAQIIKERFDLPVIFVTSHTDPETLERAKSFEPFGFIIKPVSDRELYTSIEIGLYRHGAEQVRRQEQQKSRVLEKRINQLEREAALARFAAGVAHDLNNSLTIISGNLQLLHASGEMADRNRHSSEVALSACESCRRLVQDLLGLTRQGLYVPEKSDIRDLVAKAVDIVASQLPSHIQISIEKGNPIWILGDRNQIHHAITNILINARDAMPKGGHITISFTVQESSLPESATTKTSTSQCVLVGIRDEGIGIDQADLARIFEPFYSTKRKGTGMGLGLAMVAGAMKNHNGSVRAESDGHSGTTIWLQFPLFNEESTAESTMFT